VAVARPPRHAMTCDITFGSALVQRVHLRPPPAARDVAMSLGVRPTGHIGRSAHSEPARYVVRSRWDMHTTASRRRGPPGATRLARREVKRADGGHLDRGAPCPSPAWASCRGGPPTRTPTP